MRRVVTSIALLGVLCAAAGRAHAAGATEWVMILDNSGSMSRGSVPFGQKDPINPADPDRLAVIATLIFRSFLGVDDKLTIINFDSSLHGRYSILPTNPDAIRALEFDGPTYFYQPMVEAKKILDASTLPNKKLLMVTDGAPSVERMVADPSLVCEYTPDNPNCFRLTVDLAKKILGLDQGKPGYDLISLGLGYTDDVAKEQQAFLKPLGRLEQVKSATELVSTFTKIFAESIRSRPESGRLEPGASITIPVGKYVTEVMIAVATEKPTGPFDARLDGDKGESPIEVGDSGCDKKPCHHYAVFRVAKDGEKTETMTLSLPKSGGPVAYGIILRYDLAAEIVSAPQVAKVGEELDVVARITYRGQTFNDAAFFAADGFEAKLLLPGGAAPMTAKGDGTFAGKIMVNQPGVQKLEAQFANKWITMQAGRDITVEEWMPLELKVKPPDFGKWTGGRTETRRCIDLDLTGSVNADKVSLEISAEGLPSGMALIAPTTVAGNRIKGVCLQAPGCCSDLTAKAGTTLTIRGKHPHYHPGAVKSPMKFQVAKTPFIICWWRVLAGIAGGILFTIILIGIVRPHDFPREEVIRLAKTEAALARAPARRLRELPGGRRGFYRDARASFDGAGNAIGSPSGVSLSMKAAKGDPVITARGGLEQKDPRTRKFEPVDTTKGPAYLRRGIVYRVGEFFFRMG